MISDFRLKQLMSQVGLPDSRSLYQALKQCDMEATLRERKLRPIETAPRDGTFILLFGDSGYTTTPLRCEVGRWCDYKNRWNDHGGDSFTDGGSPPTHWLPLPEF